MDKYSHEFLPRANTLMAYATKQYGFADREYKTIFGASTPTVYVYDQDTDGLIAEVWLIHDEIKVRKYY